MRFATTCGWVLDDTGTFEDHVVEDIPEPRFEVHCYRRHEQRCRCCQNVGQGKVFYYRPGHETFPVFKNPHHLKVIENTVRWMGTARAAEPVK